MVAVGAPLDGMETPGAGGFPTFEEESPPLALHAATATTARSERALGGIALNRMVNLPARWELHEHDEPIIDNRRPRPEAASGRGAKSEEYIVGGERCRRRNLERLGCRWFKG
jgi:hypothetical protein